MNINDDQKVDIKSEILNQTISRETIHFSSTESGRLSFIRIQQDSNHIPINNLAEYLRMTKKFFLLLILLAVSAMELFATVPDSTKNIISTWKLHRNNSLYFIPLDTNLYLFQKFNPFERQSISYSFLGNIGLAGTSNIFEDRDRGTWRDFIFFQHYSPYFLHPEDIVYYNVHKPFTFMNYTMSTKTNDEQTLKFVFTQNINKKMNFGFRYQLFGSKGDYPLQRTRDHTTALWYSYIGKHYRIHSNVIFNKFMVQDNGGIIDSGNIIPESLQSRLTDANSVIGNRNYFIVQEYYFGKNKVEIINDTTKKVTFLPRGAISHTFSYSRNYWQYKDAKPTKLFYQNFFLDSTKINDSTSMSSLKNTIQLKLLENQSKKFRFGSSISLTNEIIGVYNFIDSSNRRRNLRSNYATFNVFNTSSKKWNWDFLGNLFIDGYRQGDVNMNMALKRYLFGKHDSIIVEIGGNIESRTPGIFESEYYSNTKHWNNSFERENRQSLQFSFTKPAWNLNFTLKTTRINNYNYFNYKALPAQRKNQMAILTASVDKHFDLKWFHSVFSLVYQKAPNDTTINMPSYAAYNATYFEFDLFKKVLHLQVGADAFYCESFYGSSYSPDIAQFYQAKLAKTGGKPIINVFVNAKLKTALMFFKWEHINARSGDLPAFYSVNHYPIKNMQFKFGVTWRLND